MKVSEYPDLDEVTLLARKFGPEAIGEAIEIARNGSSDSIRLKAIDLVLTRGYGKAGQVAQQVVPNQLDYMTPEERVTALRNALNEEELKLAQEANQVS